MWASRNPAEWQAALAQYGSRLAAAKPQAVELDRWYTQELRPAVAAREPRHLKASELQRLMAWKLARGKFRPRLQALVDSNADDSVQKCTTAGFAALKGTPEGAAPSDAALAAAVKAISALKGVGPATASGVLAAAAPVPFMSDEACAVLPKGLKEYSLEALQSLTELLHAKAAQLSSEGRTWSVHEVEQALWSEAHSAGPAASSKRGRSPAAAAQAAKQGKRQKDDTP